jgi:hypothetical protein
MDSAAKIEVIIFTEKHQVWAFCSGILLEWWRIRCGGSETGGRGAGGRSRLRAKFRARQGQANSSRRLFALPWPFLCDLLSFTLAIVEGTLEPVFKVSFLTLTLTRSSELIKSHIGNDGWRVNPRKAQDNVTFTMFSI